MGGAAPEMFATGPGSAPVTVRYWAAARAAAGVESDRFDVGDGTTLAALLARVHELHADRPRLAAVVAVCSVLVGDRPVGGHDPAEVMVGPGDCVELLPPFAGG
jgi:molybdopterin synthase sulfur carrier subunit